jgi:hypothetical protein
MKAMRDARRGTGAWRLVVALAALVSAAACTNPMAVEEALQALPHTTSSGNHTVSSGNVAPQGR